MSLRLTASYLVVLAGVWIAWLLLTGPVPGFCNAPAPWEGEHTFAAVVVVGWLALAFFTRRRRREGADATLVSGRPHGLRDAGIRAAPVICAALILLAGVHSLLADWLCTGYCSHESRVRLPPWWSGWQHMATFAAAFIIALVSARRLGEMRDA